jgi:hypothetical protein
MKKTFAQFVAWLRRNPRVRFYTGRPSMTCPLAVFSGEPVAISNDVLTTGVCGRNGGDYLTNVFDLAEPHTPKQALAVMKKAGFI